MEDKKMTVEELLYIQLVNRTVAEQQKYAVDKANSGQLHEGLLAQQATMLKTLDMTLLARREEMRPYRLMGAIVTYYPNEKKYCCQVPEIFLSEEGEDELTEGILAYGDTGAEACDNFDHMWLHGVKDE